MRPSDATAAARLAHTIPGLLTAEECLALVREMDASRQQPAEIWLGERFGVGPESRRGTIATLGEPSEILVQDRLWEVMPTLEELYGCSVSHMSAPTALIYDRGDHFAAHSDGGVDRDAPAEIARRRISLVVALNEGAGARPDFCGGELRFHPDCPPGRAPSAGAEIVEVRSRPGLLVAFASPLVHQVMPVSAGRRYSLALWALAPAG